MNLPSNKFMYWEKKITPSKIEKLIQKYSNKTYGKKNLSFEYTLVQLFDISNDLLCVVNMQGHFCIINAAFTKLLGYSEQEVQDKPLFSFIHPDDLESTAEELNKLSAGFETVNFENRYYTKEGKIIWVSWVARPDIASDLVYGIGRDITDQKRFHDHLLATLNKSNQKLNITTQDLVNEISVRQQTYQALMDAEKEVEQTRRQLELFERVSIAGELASGIAHEVNQPLTAIRQYAGGCLNLVNQGQMPPNLKGILQHISTLAEKAGQIISRLREFLYHGEIVKGPNNINELIENILPLIKHQLKQSNIELVLALKNGLPDVTADQIQIQQVIMNLIQNSIDALKETKINNKQIAIETRFNAEHKTIEILVIDNGVGIDKKIKRTLFNQFVSTKNYGMGIGLSISKSIIDAHNGKISIASDPNTTTFTISLPIH